MSTNLAARLTDELATLQAAQKEHNAHGKQLREGIAKLKTRLMDVLAQEGVSNAVGPNSGAKVTLAETKRSAPINEEYLQHIADKYLAPAMAKRLVDAIYDERPKTATTMLRFTSAPKASKRKRADADVDDNSD